MSLTLLSTAYLPPIQYFSKLKKYKEVSIEYHEHFPKQTYRSRCHIYGANGILKLSVPIIHSGERTSIKDINISYSDNWQKLHWKSIESAYRCSPYFEFYEREFAPFYSDKKFETLIDLNNGLTQLILRLLKIDARVTPTNEYFKEITDGIDLRNVISPKVPFNTDRDFVSQQYIQVFGNKHGFIPNLSVVDLLFNEGPYAINFL